MSKVTFSNADIDFKLKGRKNLGAFVELLFSREGKDLEEVTYVFCSDEYLLDLNHRFLDHDTLTDIITFDLSSAEETIGEIYISIPRVRENAIEHQTTFDLELKRVVFHGALHLCGYKDKTKSEITEMREKEEYFLNLFTKP